MKRQKMTMEQARNYRALRNGESAMTILGFAIALAIATIVKNIPQMVVGILKIALYFKELGL